jgi:mannose-6-phosphate isomerase-like protein (cupin superfamily)
MKELQFKRLNVDTKPGRNSLMSVLELKDYIDFEVKRVYFVQDQTGASSQHAHHHEKELFVMERGSCTAIIDQGNGIEDIRMDGPSNALYIGSYVWHGFKDFEPGSVLLALSSTNYSADRSDYLENYEEYKNFVVKL